jgi:hypothetical protein
MLDGEHPHGRLLLHEVHGLSGWRATEPVRLPQPRSFSRRELNNVLVRDRSRFMVTEKSDGVRQLLMFTRIDGVPVACFMDRRHAFTNAVHGMAPTNNLFAGTLVDGELVNGDRFLIFDCMAITGTRIGHYPLNRRLFHAQTVARLATLQGTSLHCKQMLPATSVRECLDSCDGLGYAVDGLIFTPIHAPVKFGTSDVLKWKAGTRNTVDFVVRASSQHGRWDLYTTDPSGAHAFFATAVEHESIASMWLQTEVQRRETVVCECARVDGEWTLVKDNGLPKIRRDKDRANSELVARRTTTNVLENITADELIDALGDGRPGWDG